MAIKRNSRKAISKAIQKNPKLQADSSISAPLISTQPYGGGSPYSSNSRRMTTLNIVPRLVNNSSDPYRFLNFAERIRINQMALDLYRSSPLVNSAINRKNEWVCATGWHPYFCGQDTAWGKLATDYLINEALATCNVAGPNYTWNRTLLTIANQIDLAGDNLIVYAPYDTGMRVAVYPSSLVGQRTFDKTIQDGRYAGSQLDSGVIFNRGNFPIAYNILQDTPEEDFILTLREAALIFEPNELCPRGISLLASSLIHLLDRQDIQYYFNRHVKNASKMPIVVNTEQGTGQDYVGGPGAFESSETNDGQIIDANTTFNLTGLNGNGRLIQPTVIDMEDYTFFKAGSGEKIEVPTSLNPSTNEVEWLKLIGEECCSAMGWPIGLLHPSMLQGSVQVRMMEAQVKEQIRVRQKTLRNFAKSFVAMNISRAMDSGRLPRITTSDWRAFDFTMPAEFVIDSYYADQMKQTGLRTGTRTIQDVISSEGGNWEKVFDQRDIENRKKLDLAAGLVAYSKGSLTFERALDLVASYGNQNAAPLQTQLLEDEPKK